MRILFVTPYLPSPPQFGGQRRLHGLATVLAAKGHSFSVLSLVNSLEDQRASVTATQAYCEQVQTVPIVRLEAEPKHKRWMQMRSLVSRRSWERIHLASPAFGDVFDRTLRARPYDVVLFSFVYMANFLTPSIRLRAGSAKIVLDEHNIEYDVLRRTAMGGLHRRVFSEVNWRKLRREERAAWRACDGCTVTSKRDEDLLRRDEPNVATAVVPNGVDVEFFRPSEGSEGRTEPQGANAFPTILFFGANNYFPNSDGIQYFLKDIFPRIRAQRPDAKLKIVGPAPTWLLERADQHVAVTGFVDDVRPHIEGATVVIAPLRIGGGTRLKILEAMSLAKAVVSTSMGAEGLDVTHGRDLLLADDPSTFAEAVLRVVDDRALRRDLGVQARRLVESRYSWRAAVERLETFIDQLPRRAI